jgi:hypothetical protein
MPCNELCIDVQPAEGVAMKVLKKPCRDPLYDTLFLHVGLLAHASDAVMAHNFSSQQYSRGAECITSECRLGSALAC